MSSQIDELISNSQIAFLQGNYKSALKYADSALEEDSNNSDAHQCAANAYMSFEDYEKAINHYQKAIDNDPENGDRYFNLGYAYASDNQQTEALASFAKADETGCSPNVIGQLYKILGMMNFDLGMYEDAIVNLTKSEKIIGVDEDVLERKALSYGLSGDLPNGIEIANQMKMFSPTKYTGYRIAYELLLEDDRLEEAEAELIRASKFAKPSAEFFFDCLSYEVARYKLDDNKAHLVNALRHIERGLATLKPTVYEVVDSYINAADMYIQLEDADMAIHCLNAAENPAYSYNERLSVLKPVFNQNNNYTPSERDITKAIEDARRQYGDNAIARIAKERMNNGESNEHFTPAPAVSRNADSAYKLDREEPVQYLQENTDKINRFYLAAYTIKNDINLIKSYASRLASSSDVQSKYIGKYSLVKALKDEKYPNIEEEYDDLIKFFRNASIKDPSDLMAVTLRVQCYADIGKYEEAEKLCDILSEDIRGPLVEQINSMKNGGDK